MRAGGRRAFGVPILQRARHSVSDGSTSAERVRFGYGGRGSAVENPNGADDKAGQVRFRRSLKIEVGESFEQKETK